MIILSAAMFALSAMFLTAGCCTNDRDVGSRLVNASAIFTLAGCVCLR